jgi:hypothetical protein
MSYEMKVPKDIAERVTVQDLSAQNQQAVSDGAICSGSTRISL